MTLSQSEARSALRMRIGGAALAAGGLVAAALVDPDWPGFALAGLGALAALVAPLVANLAEGWGQ
jgi:hypothetical protein